MKLAEKVPLWASYLINAADRVRVLGEARYGQVRLSSF